MIRRTCHFSGQVQGVGFRQTAHGIARQFTVHGYVRNLADGRVELVMEGTDDKLDGLLQSLRQRMDGFIREVKTHDSQGTGEFKDFGIRH